MWHVDDRFGSSNHPFLNWVKEQIKDQFGISDMRPVSLYLGTEIKQDQEMRDVWIHQEAYIHYLCDEYGLSDANAVSTPMDHQHPFRHDGEMFPDMDNLEHVYRKIIGELIYLSTCSHPDIAFTVQCLVQQCTHPKAHHFAVAKCVVCYLHGMLSLHIHFGNPKVNLSTHAFSDSDWATNPSNCMSITGYVWFFYRGPIAHASKKQVTHALSTAEAEYMALSACAQEGLRLKSFLHSLHQLVSLPLCIHADNTVAISLAVTPSNCSQTCHIGACFHFVQEHIACRVFELHWTPTYHTYHNVADTLMKSLDCQAFADHRVALSLVSR